MISIRARTVVTGTDVHADGGWVTIDGDRVSAVGDTPPPGAERIDLGEAQLWPGLVDLHADSLGRFESPRAGTRIPLDVAVYDFTLDAVRHGITRPFLCVAVGEGPEPANGLRRALDVLRTLRELDGALPLTVPVHLRVDVGADRCLDDARVLLDRFGRRIALVSAMDHTPGRRQYARVDTWRDAMRDRTGADDRALDEWLSWLPAQRSSADERAGAVARLAHEYGCPFASHDDDSPASAERAAAEGAVISEFPLTLDTARAARRSGLTVVMGAPNAWRGGSHLAGLSAGDAVRAGLVDALASDYHSGSMVRAALTLAATSVCGLSEAVRLMSEGPAAAIALDAGTLRPGSPADLIAVTPGPIPAVTATWIAGRRTPP
ncbi:alpha-D-ribose 1-methylphosphonate 5-triphosphate diphosphatase [Pseudonocardia spinosispora]|uniref:alpha-D-ribose 1-methylphosphonate 5-triphosphate diphosphatase n=1 Tax=Pseudonocardia spinosispora TaxID=103441 RepID=UPI0003FA3E4B|nr:alpha-D-ribose 1-methylphosphonate 5-triphosphate diphosphatase [Pseudonocardia spinosispora]